jgi:poly(3-hydroxybutyrate) depolymerase
MNPRSVVSMLVLVILSMFNVSTAGTLKVADDSAQFITWNYKGAEMGFYLPKSTNKLPIVMYLHYCTGNPVYPEFWIVPALSKIEPCAVFLPTAPAEVNTQYPCADWGGTYDQSMRPNLVNALHELDSLITLHGLDQSRVYIYGESMGGEGVYRLLMDFSERFAGGVVASGYTVDKGADKMAKTPLWIFHGSDDNTASVMHGLFISQSGILVEHLSNIQNMKGMIIPLR